MGYLKFDFTSTDDIKRRHQGNWFSPDVMRLFKSRVHAQIYHGDSLIYFVSSESVGPLSGERAYRSYCPKTDLIETIGEFNGYKSRSSAHNAAVRIARQELASNKC